MIIKNINIYRFTIPLVRPLIMMNNIQNHRRGYIVEIIDNSGNISYGETSPFPGLNKESSDSALENLKSVSAELCGIELPNSVDSILNFTENIRILPSVRFGIETALLYLLSLIENRSLALLLNPDASKYIELNSLITTDLENIVEELNHYIEDGYKTIKVKVGENIKLHKARLKYIIDTVKYNNNIDNYTNDNNIIGIRLDANRSLYLNSAIELFAGIDTEFIEYIEEPLRNIARFNDFYDATNVPIALDETITECTDLAEYFNSDFIAAFILKPTVIGSYKNMAEIYEKAAAAGKKTVISSSFESGIGLRALANIASAFNKIPTAAGLDTFKWLNEDVIINSFVDFGPHISLEKINSTAYNLNINLLERVTY